MVLLKFLEFAGKQSVAAFSQTAEEDGDLDKVHKYI